MPENFRLNAGIVVFDHSHRVLVCERSDIRGSWQFPQGGIEAGESPEQAAKRELYEETSIKSAVCIKTLTDPARYHFPPKVIQSMQKKGYQNAGQDIYWSLFFFSGDEKEINLKTETPEFCRYKWVKMHEVLDLIVDFKKEAYAVAVKEFSPIIQDYIPEGK